MAEWLFGSLFLVLLCTISIQLRGLRKQLSVLKDERSSDNEDAGISFEAWLQELESKGTEILGRIENERRAAETALNQTAAQAGTRNTPVEPPQPAPTPKPASKATDQPTFAQQVGEVQVQNWVRTQSGVPEKSNAPWAKGQQKIGQDWTNTQRQVMEMAERGVAASTIARSLGLAQGEVQLILSKATLPSSGSRA